MTPAFDGAGVGLARVGADGRYLSVNPALARLLGAEPAQLEGERCLLTHAADGRPCDRGHQFEHELPEHGRWLLVNVAPGDGHAVVAAMDITESKAKERELRASEAMFRMAFENSPVGVAISTPDGDFLRVNQAVGRLHGYEPAQMIGMHWSELVPAEARADVAEASDTIVQESPDGRFEMDVPALEAGGARGWVMVNVNLVPGESGEPAYSVAHVQDITDRKLAEIAMRDGERRYRSLVEHLPVGIFRMPIDGDGTMSYVSPQLQGMLGYPTARWASDPELLSRVLHPDDRERVFAGLAEMAATGADFRSEHRLVAADGRILTARVEACMLDEEQAGERQIQGYVQDVSEARRLEEQLRIAQKLESIGQLAAGIAHEINTPIQFVSDSAHFVADAFEDLLGLVEAYDGGLAEANGDLSPAARRRLEDARELADLEYLRERLPAAFARTADGIDRVREIVHAVRQFAHPQGGDRQPIDINEALRTTLVVARSHYRYVADVETDLGELPAVLADGGELNQVFINLIVNAADAIADVVDDGGRGVIRIATAAEPGEVVIRIGDTGGGIPAELQARVFDPFFTTKPVGKGTGQGLAISHAIVCERHGGAIAIESEPGAGTTVEVRLPVTHLPDDDRLTGQVDARR